jgi:ATP-binding cassette subfamily B protein
MEGHAEGWSGSSVVTRSDDASPLFHHLTDTTLVRGATSLLISHRFGSVRMADEIAVVEDGRITEHGRHADLVACEGTYAHLYRAQAARYG